MKKDRRVRKESRKVREFKGRTSTYNSKSNVSPILTREVKYFDNLLN